MSRKQATPSEIDQLYGLEPVYEPGSDPRLVSLAQDTEVRCPWCAERWSIQIDVSAGSRQNYIEDCQICCRPIEFSIELNERNGQPLVQARRAE